MDSLVDDPEWATQYSIHELVEKAGTQGVELLMWLATRGAVPGRVRKVHTNYHIPISNTAAGMMALEAKKSGMLTPEETTAFLSAEKE